MRTIAILFIITLFSLSVHSQGNTDIITSSQDIDLADGAVGTVIKPVTNPDNIKRKRIVNAGFKLTLSVQENNLESYLGQLTEGEELTVTLAIEGNNTGNTFEIFLQDEYGLSLNYNEHTAVLHKDFTRKLDWLVNNGFDLPSIEVTVNGISDITNKEAVLSLLSLKAEYYITYGYDVKLTENSSVSPPTDQKAVMYGSRTVDFSWEHSFPYSAYELQLLHFPQYEEGQYQLLTVDWDKALKMLVPVGATRADNTVISAKNLKSFRLISSTGLYIWRVRAIGGYHEGGLGNGDNFGAWSENLSSIVNIAQEKENVYWFYFEDADSSINTIRSRVYTEDLKVKEINTYADGLQNVKQTQVNIPSNHTSIVTQTEQDFTGRNSLTSIPAPLGYETDRYEENILKDLEGGQYTAEDFDNAENGGITPPVLEDGALSYYNNNSNQRIANTEGFPFSRTTYYNDGLNRVKEQSAPGSAFANKEDGTGHLIRYLYGTASETELIRIFGSDAPNPQNVSKTVVIDQNNIATTTFKTIDGNVIATCLNLAGEEGSGLLPLDNQPDGTSFTTTETVHSNLKTEYGFYSSKRLVLPQATTLLIDYEISNASVKALCAEVTGDCEYQVEINVVDLATEEIVYEIPATAVSESTPVSGSVGLPAGSYLVQKKLYSESSGIDKETLREKVAAQIQTLYDIVQFWLQKAECNGRGESYYKCLEVMQDLAVEQQLDNLYLGLAGNNLAAFDFRSETDWETFTEIYKDESFPKGIYALTFYKVTGDGSLTEINDISLSNPPDYVYIETGSCCNLYFPAKYVETFDFSKSPEINSDGSVYPDFEAYAKEFLSGCIPDGSIYQYMDGWPEGAFNLMIYHMLTDQYDRTNPIVEAEIAEEEAQNPPEPEEPELDECGNPIDESCADGKCYSMRNLFICWKGVLSMLKEDLKCSGLEIEYGMEEEDEQGFYDPINEENGDDGDSQDSHYDENFDMKGFVGWIAKRLAKRKISKRIKDMDASPDLGNLEVPESVSTRHLVKDFLECTGYQFGKIITGFDPLPLDDDVYSGFDYLAYGSHSEIGTYPVPAGGITSRDYFSNYKNVDHDYDYIPLNDFDPRKKIINDDNEIETTDEHLFLNIKNPVYAFKYFVYNEHGLPEYAALEQITCFDDPNDCFMLDADGSPVYDEETRKVRYIPACVSYLGTDNDPDNVSYGFCFKDFNYPLVDTIENASTISGDYRFGEEDGAYFRWVANEFVNEGRLRCPYTHEIWSSGQRYTFYRTMLSYRYDEEETTEEDTFIEDCESMLPSSENPKWYRSGKGEIIHEELYNELSSELTQEELDGYDEITYADYYYPGTETYDVDGTATERTGSLSRVELEMARMVKSCKTACAKKRNEVDRMVRSVLASSGYTIGGCISDETPENIPEEDVEVMVDELLAKCGEQCVVTTFACEDVLAGEARFTYASKWEPGSSASICK